MYKQLLGHLPLERIRSYDGFSVLAVPHRQSGPLGALLCGWTGAGILIEAGTKKGME